MRRVMLDLPDDAELMSIAVAMDKTVGFKFMTAMASHLVNLTEHSHITFDGENWEDEK